MHRESAHQTIDFVEANAAHLPLFPRCVELVDRTQGIGIFKTEYFEQCLINPNFLVMLALQDKDLIGVATARVLPPDGAAYYAPFGPDAAELFRRHRVGSLECASVQESWQGRAIGREMAIRRVGWLEKMGCNAMIGIAWQNGRRTSDGTFRGLGFKREGCAENFYIKPSTERGFICPVCGRPPCRCAAVLYVRR